jgi:hypothetical protein
MPPDLRELTSLQILTYFVAGASSGCSTIGELHNLDLGGKLMLSCLENVTEVQAKVLLLEIKRNSGIYLSNGVVNAMRNMYQIVIRWY